MTELERLSGIAAEQAALLRSVGIDSAESLATTNPDALFRELESNQPKEGEGKISRLQPVQRTVKLWMRAAQGVLVVELIGPPEKAKSAAAKPSMDRGVDDIPEAISIEDIPEVVMDGQWSAASPPPNPGPRQTPAERAEGSVVRQLKNAIPVPLAADEAVPPVPGGKVGHFNPLRLRKRRPGDRAAQAVLCRSVGW